jgi:hypothetical protein
MREKELRLALICYGGISLAVYMHGITKEVWHLAKASQSYHGGLPPLEGSKGVYRRLLERFASEQGIELRVLVDILTGASAGGINAIFLADAISTGHSLDPLTDLGWTAPTSTICSILPSAPCRVWPRRRPYRSPGLWRQSGGAPSIRRWSPDTATKCARSLPIS